MRMALALLLGLGGLTLALVLTARQSSDPDRRLEVVNATASQIDTVRVSGRIVEVSLGGQVVQVGPGDRVWLSTGGDAVALRFPTGVAIAVEDHLLVQGRLRARRGRRWVEVRDWVSVEPAVAAPAGQAL